MPYWPGNAPNPYASSSPPTVAVVVEVDPAGSPVFTGAVNAYG